MSTKREVLKFYGLHIKNQRDSTMADDEPMSVDQLTKVYRQQALLLAVAATKNGLGNADGDDDDNEQEDAVGDDECSSRKKKTAPQQDLDGSDDGNDDHHGKNLNEIDESESLPSWHVAQHVLDLLYRGQNPSSSASMVVENSNPSSIKRIIHVCPDCGNILQPGYNGTTLRVVRPNNPKSSSSHRRTLRRRRQRLMKRRANAKQREGKSNNNNTNTNNNDNKRKSIDSNKDDNDETNNDDARVTTMENIELVPLVDDVGYLELDRHYLVITCGSCHGKIHLKGVKQPKQQDSKDEQVQQVALAGSHKVYNQQQPKKKQRTDISNNKNEEEEEFMALPSLKTNDRSFQSSSSAQPPIPLSTTGDQKSDNQQPPPNQPKQLPLTLLGSSKKKKKQKKKPASQLMDFLSSLND